MTGTRDIIENPVRKSKSSYERHTLKVSLRSRRISKYIYLFLESLLLIACSKEAVATVHTTPLAIKDHGTATMQSTVSPTPPFLNEFYTPFPENPSTATALANGPFTFFQKMTSILAQPLAFLHRKKLGVTHSLILLVVILKKVDMRFEHICLHGNKMENQMPKPGRILWIYWAI